MTTGSILGINVMMYLETTGRHNHLRWLTTAWEHIQYTNVEVSRAWWRCAASHTKSLLDKIQCVLRPYVCSREDSEVFHSLFYALLTPSYSWLSNGKKLCLFTDARFPYTISAPLFGGTDRHRLNSRTQKVQEWEGILQSTVHPYIWVGSALGNKHLQDSCKSIW